MGKKTTIPAGYRLTVVSWENDADNYNTKVLMGLDASDVRFYVDLCKTLSRNSKKNFANMYDPGRVEKEKFFEHLKTIIETHNRTDYQDAQYWQDHIMELLYDLGLSGGDFFTRVCDKFQVEYIEQPIVLDDVTKDFI